MPDREKVIKGLECCTRYEVGKQLNNCLDCPYVEPIGFNQFRCKSQEMKEDALALLKEQKAEAKWIYGEDETGVDGWHCSECDFFEPWFYEFTDDIDFIRFYGFCPKCGAKMASYTGKPTQEGR